MPVCPSCGEDNPERAKFCLNCATPLAEAPPPGEERKVVTVLFADVAESTGLGERLDPERLREVMGAYFEAMREQIEAEGGTVEKFIGDAVMAAFGVPAAHEDDPARALRAALRMRERLGELNRILAEVHGVTLKARIGVNTGDVVAVTAPRPGEGMVTGDAVNVAARLEQAAEPGGILVSARTARAVRGFRFRQLAPLSVKGRGEVVQALELLDRVEAPVPERGVPGLEAPLVGREREVALLEAVYERTTAERRPYLVTIYGDAGVGKSRLTREFLGWAEGQVPSPEVLQGRCLPYGKGVTYWPLAEMLKGRAGVLDTDPPAMALEKIGKLAVDLLETVLPDPRRTAAALAYTVGLEDPEVRYRDMAPRQVRLEVHAAWRSFFSTMAMDRPVVAVVEDIHWADPALLDLLEEVADRAEGSLLVLCPARPELTARRPGWGGGRRSFASIALDPLSQAEAERLVGLLLAVEELPEAARARMLERAEGNPFFLEEIVRKLIDEGLIVRRGDRWRAVDAAFDPEIPDTVQGVLAARIDLLSAEHKRVLQMAAIVGRVFWSGPVARLLGGGGQDLEEILDVLEARELVRGRIGSSIAGQSEFIFKHILTRDVAYESLPRRERARAHAEVAGWIEETAGERVHEFVELLAHHFGEAHAAAREDPRWDPSDVDELRRSAFRYLLVGSIEARSKFALGKAEELAEAATPLAATARERSDALAALGLAYRLHYQGDLAWRFLREAVDALREDPTADQSEITRLCAEALETPTRWPGSMRADLPIEEVAPYLALGMKGVRGGQDEISVHMLTVRAFWPFAYPSLATPEEMAAAREAGEEAATIAMRMGRPDLASGALDGVGSTYFAWGLYGPSWPSIERRLDMAGTLEDPWELGDIYAVAAWCRWAVGHYREALAHADSGFQRLVADVPGVALHCLSWRGLSRWRLGEWDVLLEDLAKAEEILGDRRETPPPFAIGVFGAAATVEQVRGRQAGADRLLSLLVRVAEAKERAPWAQGWIAGLQARRGATEDARRMLLHQLEAPAPSRGFLLEALCEVLEEGGLWGEVGSVAEMARSWAEEAGLVALPFFADRLEGRAALAEGDADRAVALLARAGEGFGQLGAPWDQARAHLYLGEALAAKGDIETARKRLAGALSEFERLGSVRELDRSRALLATLA